MQRRIYLTGVEKSTGKSFVSLGFLSALLEQHQAIHCFKLFAEKDSSQLPLLERITKQPVTPILSIDDAIEMMHNQPEELLSKVLDQIKISKKQFSYFEGTNFDSDQDADEFQLNLMMACQLNSEVILVISAKDRTIEHTQSLLHSALETAKRHYARVIGVIINRFDSRHIPLIPDLMIAWQKKVPLLTILPEFEQLSYPSMRDIARKLGAEVLCGSQELQRPVANITIAAKTVGNFLESRLDRTGMLIITPADRIDILLGSLLADQSAFYPKIAGIVLTGEEKIGNTIHKIIQGLEHPFPVLLAKEHTYQTATTLFTAKFSLNIQDFDKVKLALDTMQPHFNALILQLLKLKTLHQNITPAVFLHDLMQKAARVKRHIVLPEGSDARILKAAAYLLKRQVVNLTILGHPEQIALHAKRLDLDISEAHLLDIHHSEHAARYAEKYYEIRKHKNVNMAIAQERMTDPNFYAAMMVYFGDADGMVSGAVHTTADTVRPALEIIKTQADVSRVSSVFIMCLASRVVIYGDCAINPEPDSELLAEIALQAADMAQRLGIEARTALLSYSSGTSGKGASVDKVTQAMAILKQKKPDLLVEGPIQYDAAVDAEVAKTKLPHSHIAGKANVLIFPDLNTGNNTYKAVQRETGALAIGPILLGLNKPVNDLSRGCTPQDIIHTILITALQVK